MSARTVHHLDDFWELIDEVLNVSLFVVIGLEVLTFRLSFTLVLLGVAAALFVAVARFLSVAATVFSLRYVRRFEPHTTRILT